MSRDLFIGLMSGTSMDAVDAALVDFSSGKPELVHTLDHPIPDELRSTCQALCVPGNDEIDRMGHADGLMGDVFAEAALQLLDTANIDAQDITAIGSHGQTIRHRPDVEQPFSLQIGDANRIAERTNITTVADFRRRDMAAGGQGAPLVPAFHAAVFQSADIPRVIVNIGGIANITVLPTSTDSPVTGFDTGPGNCLMDGWVQKHQQQFFDQEGQWAASGEISKSLLNQFMSDEYFDRHPPKSTGREKFNMAWLEENLAELNRDIAAENVQATLCELTAVSITVDIRQHATDTKEVFVCGGGTRNTQLMTRLQEHLDPIEVKTTDEAGLPAEWIEAMAFAWLARETLAHRPGNVPGVTGASHPVILGAVYYS
ncbi:anhydro-N-acetylmuramic acid kinase [Kaarinaea lacus]